MLKIHCARCHVPVRTSQRRGHAGLFFCPSCGKAESFEIMTLEVSVQALDAEVRKLREQVAHLAGRTLTRLLPDRKYRFYANVDLH